MFQVKNVMHNTLVEGTVRETRAGKTTSKFFETVSFNLQDGFPAVTCKQLATKPMFGELLWFLNGETDLPNLRKRSGLADNAWTIWTDDCARWHNGKYAYASRYDNDNLGVVYGAQWINFNGDGIDQLSDLVDGLVNDPFGRRHIVTAWNPSEMSEMALPPCHLMFQFYVREEHGEKYLDLVWHQRSVDVFLGLAFNIASYATMVHIFAQICGYKVGMLHGTLGDTHIYEQHMDGCQEYLKRVCLGLPELVLPRITCLEDLRDLTADDFELVDYQHQGKIAGKLSVGS